MVAGLLLLAHSSVSQEVEYTSLPALLDEGTAAYRAGRHSEAAAAFRRVRIDYAEEPEWNETELPRKLLPLEGFASLRSGHYNNAIEAIETFLDQHSEPSNPETFARYILAAAHLRDRQLEQARAAFETLSQSAENASLRGIATIIWARLHPQGENYPNLLEKLSAVSRETIAIRVRVQARLLMARLAMDNQDFDTARQALLQHDWSSARMPELATLSYLSFKLGDALLESKPNDALGAYRLVTPHATLIREQKARIEELGARIRNAKPNLSDKQQIWADFYSDIAATLNRQLTELEASQDYSNLLLLRKASCFESADRPLEAWIILEKLSMTNDPELSPLAHRSWIRIARNMGAWHASATIARKYIELYPDRNDVDEALYWIGQAQLEIEAYSEALSTFGSLSERSSDSSLKSSALYFQGYCHSQLGQHELAIRKFEHVVTMGPNRPIAAQASVWIGITLFMQNEFKAAASQFEEIEGNADWSFVHPEAQFRRSAALYAEGEYTPAKSILANWLNKNASHPRYSEAALLSGDVQFELNELTQALEAYAKVSPEERVLRYFAITKKSDILRSLDRHPEALRSLEQFATKTIPGQFVGAFYLQWHSLLEDRNNSADAEKLLEYAIREYGNDPFSANLVELILKLPAIEPQNLGERATAAREQDLLTLAARYALAKALRKRSLGDESGAETVLLDIAANFDMADLPPECLAEIGLALVAFGSLDSPSYFNRILDSYPNSDYVALAYFGLAKHHALSGNQKLALTTLDSIDLALLEEAKLHHVHSLKGELLLGSGRTVEARATFEQLLANRSIAPADKAKALFAIGQCFLAESDPEKAYASFQRIFTLYRGERNLVAQSYYHCIDILYSQSSYEKSLAVCDEFLAQTDLLAEPAYRDAETLRLEILSRLNQIPDADSQELTLNEN